MKRIFGLIAFVTLVALLAGCGPAATVATQAPAVAPTVKSDTAPAAQAGPLEIKGLVAASKSLTLDQLKALSVVKETVETPKSGKVEFEGVKLTDLFALVQADSKATTIVFTASDGYSSEVDYAAVSTCVDCIVAFTADKGLYTVMPGHASKAWIKNLVTIELK